MAWKKNDGDTNTCGRKRKQAGAELCQAQTSLWASYQLAFVWLAFTEAAY